jgi:hypothetical protein
VQFSFKNDPSQGGEQDFLMQYFKDIENGHYVEIGAFHPIYFSNSIGLKKRGWKGISYEANSDFKLLWRFFRNSDELIISAVLPNYSPSNTTKFYFMERGVDGTSSVLMEHARDHAKRYGVTFREAVVPSISIAEVLDNFLAQYSKAPDLLLIDIEGLDLAIFETICSNIPFNKLPKWIFLELLDTELNSSEHAMVYDRIGSVGPNVLFKLKDVGLE